MFCVKFAENWTTIHACLGDIFYFGRNVTDANYLEAAKWYRASAQQGDQHGQLLLAIMYENGVGGLDGNKGEAIKLYKKSSEQGNEQAHASLKRLGYSE